MPQDSFIAFSYFSVKHHHFFISFKVLVMTVTFALDNIKGQSILQKSYMTDVENVTNDTMAIFITFVTVGTSHLLCCSFENVIFYDTCFTCLTSSALLTADCGVMVDINSWGKGKKIHSYVMFYKMYKNKLGLLN